MRANNTAWDRATQVRRRWLRTILTRKTALQHIVVAIEGTGSTCAVMENGTTRNSWRSPPVETRACFAALRDLGYPLAAVEQLVLPDTAPSSAEESSDAGSSPPRVPVVIKR